MLSSVSVAACCCLGWCRLGMNFEADCDVKTIYSLSYLLIGLKVTALSCPDWRSKDVALWTESNGVTLYGVVRAASCSAIIFSRLNVQHDNVLVERGRTMLSRWKWQHNMVRPESVKNGYVSAVLSRSKLAARDSYDSSCKWPHDKDRAESDTILWSELKVLWGTEATARCCLAWKWHHTVVWV